MTATEDFLQRIIETEADNTKTDLKNYSIIFTKRFHKSHTSFNNQKHEFTVSPINKISIILGLLTFLFILIKLGLGEEVWSYKKIFILLILVTLFVLFCKQALEYLSNPENFYPIVVSDSEISINNKVFSWDEIMFTAIMTEQHEDVNSKYLIVGLINGTTYEKTTIGKFETHKFSVFERKLANCIEYYKCLNQKSTL